MVTRNTTDRPRCGDRVWYGKRLFEDKKNANGTVYKLVFNEEGFECAWVNFADGCRPIQAEEFIGSFNGRLGATGTWVIEYGKEHPALGTFKLENGQIIPIKGASVPDEGC